MRPTIVCIALTALLGSGAAANAQERDHWYGYDIIIADVASGAVAAAGALSSSGSGDTAAHVVQYVGFAGFLAGSPLIHALGHRQYGRAALAFAIRDAPWIGAVLLANSCHGGFDDCIGTAFGAFLLGIIGTAGVIVDWAALSWEPATPPRVTVVPLVGRAHGAALAVRF